MGKSNSAVVSGGRPISLGQRTSSSSIFFAARKSTGLSLAPVSNRAAVSIKGYVGPSRPADQYASEQHQDAADDHLERRLQEGRIHEARADIGDRPKLEEDDDASDAGGDPE